MVMKPFRIKSNFKQKCKQLEDYIDNALSKYVDYVSSSEIQVRIDACDYDSNVRNTVLVIYKKAGWNVRLEAIESNMHIKTTPLIKYISGYQFIFTIPTNG